MPTSTDFREALITALAGAELQNLSFIDISAGNLHELVGDYPGPDHRMPSCCAVMRGEMGANDVILTEPPKGTGASLTIRYHIPR